MHKNKISHLSLTVHKTEQKSDKGLETLKSLKGNLGEIIQDHGIGDDFFLYEPKHKK